MEKVPRKSRWRLKMRQREMLTGYVFILPVLIGLAFFFFPMFVRVIQYSFSDIYLPFGEQYELIPMGLYHYNHAFFVHPTYLRVLTEMVTGILWNVPLIIFFSLFMAVLLNRQFPGRLLVRAIFFLPVIMAVPAIQATLDMVMIMMSDGMMDSFTEIETETYFDAGMVAWMLVGFGVPTQLIDFIVSAIVGLNTVIRSGGVQMLIFLAALQAIPSSMYEAAQVEGTTGYEMFWKITLPMISPLILTNVVYTIIDIYTTSQPVVMAQAAAFGATRNFGLSAVMSLSSSFTITALILLSGFFISRKVVYLT